MKNSRIELDVLLRRVDATADAMTQMSQQLQLVMSQLLAPAPNHDHDVSEKP